MNNKDGKIGIILLITIVLIFILSIGFVIFTIANTNDEDNTDKNTIKKIQKEKKEEETKKEKKESNTNFLNVISTIEYINEKRYIDYYPIEVSQNDKKDLYNPTNGKKIVSDVSSYDWFGKFGIIYDNVNKIIDINGQELFTSSKKIEFLNKTNTWIYNNTLFSDNEERYKADKIISIDNKNNKYYLAQKNNKLVVVDEKGTVKYEKKVSDSIKDIDGEMDSIFSVAYALINYDNNYAIINPENGKVILDFINEEIEKRDNVFYTDNKTYYIKDDKIAISLNKKVRNIEISKKYIALDNDVYNTDTLSLANPNIYISEDSIDEANTGLERTSCRVGYGLKYKDKEILDCTYDKIIYFDNKINNNLLSSNKLYVITHKDDIYELYDVINNKVVIDEILDFEKNSQFIQIAKGEDLYIYNIILNTESLNKYSDNVELGYNYYAILREGKINYYNNENKLIYEGKI